MVLLRKLQNNGAYVVLIDTPLFILGRRTLCPMAEKIHYLQPAQLKGCFYLPLLYSDLPFVRSNKVIPSYQSSFLSSNTHTLAPEKPSLTPLFLGQKTIHPIRFSVVTRKKTLVPLKSHSSLFTQAAGLLHFLGSLVFFLFDTMHVEQNAHWRTIVVTQQ